MEPGGYVCVVCVPGHPCLSQKNQGQAWFQYKVFTSLLSGACLKPMSSNSLKWGESEQPGRHLRHSVYSLLRRQHAEQGKHHKHKESQSQHERIQHFIQWGTDGGRKSVLLRSPDVHQLLNWSSSVKELLVNLCRRNLNPLWYLCRYFFPRL